MASFVRTLTDVAMKKKSQRKSTAATPADVAVDTADTKAGTHQAAYQPPYLAAGLAALAVLVLYAITLAPTTHFWDASEYIATAHIFGVPHPPGNPLFIVLARAWELLLEPTGLVTAVRINLFSAVMGAMAHGLWFLVTHRILSYYSDNRWFRLAGAAAAVAIGATAFTVWNQSNVNEKVYTISLFTVALLSWLVFRWRDNLGQGKDDNLILLMAFILALSVGNHLMALLAAPALGLMILLVAPRTLLNWRIYAATVAVVALGLSIHLFLPLRASLDPIINQADPSTLNALWESLTRQQYDKPSVLSDPTYPFMDMPRTASLFAAQIGNYLQYFDWQWARSLDGTNTFFASARAPFTILFATLGIIGAASHYRRDRISFAYVAMLFATLSVALVFYLNFRYGYSYPVAAEQGAGRVLREVRERDYFFIVSFSLWGVWAGIGLAAVWKKLADRFSTGRGPTRRPRFALASPILALALLPLVLNWNWASRANDYSARDWAYNLLMSVEPYGVLFTNGDNDTFPLWYLQEVEGIRQDVQVLVMSYLNTRWYVKQAKGLTTPCAEGQSPEQDRTRIICQRPYRPEQGPEIYAELVRERGRPTRSAIGLSEEGIDSVIAAYHDPAGRRQFLIDQPLTLSAADIQFTVPAPQPWLLTPSDYFLLHIVQNSLGDRPIYFSTTTDAHGPVGLRPFTIRQGLAFKLADRPIDPEEWEGLVPMPEGPAFRVTGPYVDLPRTNLMLEEVFVHAEGFPEDWAFWPDRPTQSIPAYYAWTHYSAAQAHEVLEEQEEVDRHMARADVWRDLAQR